LFYIGNPVCLEKLIQELRKLIQALSGDVRGPARRRAAKMSGAVPRARPKMEEEVRPESQEIKPL